MNQTNYLEENNMKNFSKTFTSLAVAAAFLSAAAVANTTKNESLQESTSKLLTATFESRQVVKIEAGDFHFLPGQVAPIHTHAAPAIGYVSKGQILYQVEGGKPKLLHEGDAFYEPAGPRILRFDNASATEEAIFIDFNLQQEGEPFILFEKELTEHIDRRTLPTIDLKDQSVNQADIFVSEIESGGHKTFERSEPILGYVAEGVITLRIKDKETKRFVAGESFSLAVDETEATITNVSFDVPAKVISFYLR